MLKLTLREGEKLHIGDAELIIEKKGKQFAVLVKAPIEVPVYRERVLENLRAVLSGKEVAMFKYECVESFNAIGNNTQRKFRFPNGYGASVVIGPYTYGGPDGLYELAVLNSEGGLCYSTPITDDVIGHLSVEGVNDLLDKIAALPPCVQECEVANG